MNKKSLSLLLERGYDFDIEASFRKGWEMFSQNAINSVAYTMFMVSVQLLIALYIPEFTLLYSIFLFAPLVGGFFLVANKISQNEQILYPDFFQGFRYYMPLIIINIVAQVLIALGLILLILPGIYLMVSYMFAFLIAIFAGTDFWVSMELSRKIIHLRWRKFFILFLLLLVLNALGVLTIAGLLLTVPVSMYVIYAAFEMVTEDAVDEEE